MAISDPSLNRDAPGAASAAPASAPARPPAQAPPQAPSLPLPPAGGAQPRTARSWRGRLPLLPLLRWFSPRRLWATAAFLLAIARQIRRRRAEPRLTVAVDIDAFYETLTGVGWYLYEILDHLARRDDLRLRLYGHALSPPGPLAAGGPSAPTPPAALVRTVPMGGPAPLQQTTQAFAPAPLPAPPTPLAASPPLPAGSAIEHVTYSAPDGLVVPPWRADQWLRRAAPLLVAADRNRVLFGPNFLLPPLFRFAGGARVAAIHDLAFRRLPWAVRPDTARALADGLERTLLEADLLLTDSLAVAGELVAGGVAPFRVRAIHLGPGHLPSPSVLAAAAPPAGTPDRYGLFVGTLEPRKNVATLLAAWRELRRDEGKGGATPLLVCGPRGWRAQALRRQLAEAEREGWLRYLGYVSPAELAALYRGAAVVALPSLYEGFGMPAVEAMVAGAPLVLSDLPVFREVAGDAALYAPAGRPDLWCDRLRQVLGDDALRQDLSRRARERGARFDWHRAAAATADAWRHAAGAAGAVPG
jgi:glycosyltransferase involved in cell wall biosynthesis